MTESDQNRPAKVLLLGASLGTGNRGVSALGASLVRLFRTSHPDLTVGMLLGHRTSTPFVLPSVAGPLTVPVLNYRLSPRAGSSKNLFVWLVLACFYRALPLASWRAFLRRRHPLIRASAESQSIGDIRGGDSFSDIYGVRGFLLGSLGVLAVLLVRGHIVLFPQTYGPYKSLWARAVARFILRRASIILSRDRESMGTVTRLIGQTDRCQFCPDVAFSLEARPPESVQIAPPLPSEFPLSALRVSAFERSAVSGPSSVVSDSPLPSEFQLSAFNVSAFENPPSSGLLIGLNVNGLMFNGGYTRKNMFGLRLDYPQFLVRLLERLLADTPVRVLLVPHTFAPPASVESDPAACRKVREQLSPALQSRVHLVEGEYDQSEIKGVIGHCDFFIGSRMHACIAALSQGIPAIGVAYSKKFRGVFETVGAEDWIIDGRDMDADQAVKRVLELYAQRDVLRTRLATTVPAAQARLYAVFKELLHPGAASAPVGDPTLLSVATPDKASTNLG